MPVTIDLNADLGEGAGRSHLAEDEALLELVSSANIACGYHAGDATSMCETVRAAKKHGVAIGAHPSYPDIPGFGRRELGLDPREIRRHVASQVSTLGDVCAAEGARLAYVKPHGALYNRAAHDPRAAAAIAEAIRDVNPALPLLGLAGSEMMRAAARAGIGFASEAFVDRGYRADGTLVPREEPGAIISDVGEAVERAIKLVSQRSLSAVDGTELHVHAQSLCVHGDNPDARAMLQELRTRLESAGLRIAAFAS